MAIDLTTVGACAAAFGSGGFFAWIPNWRKAKPEAAKILIEGAGDVVVLQRTALQDLQTKLEHMEFRLERVTAERDALELRVKAMEDELHLERAKRIERKQNAQPEP